MVGVSSPSVDIEYRSEETTLASEEMVEFSASGAPERPATSLAQARRGDEVAIGTVG
jgi:hypothetical protein